MRALRIALLMAAAIGCSTRGTPRPTSDDNQEIERAVDAITDSISAAVNRKDVTRLGQLLGNAQYIGSGLIIAPGQFATTAGPAFSQLATIHQTWQARDVRVLTPQVALMTGRATTISRDTSGKAGNEQGVYTMVFVADSAGVWRLVSIHKTVLQN